jgi:hypothetical protein
VEELLEAAQVGGKALGEPFGDFARVGAVVDAGSPGCEESSQTGALIGSPSRMELNLASR